MLTRTHVDAGTNDDEVMVVNEQDWYCSVLGVKDADVPAVDSGVCGVGDVTRGERAQEPLH